MRIQLLQDIEDSGAAASLDDGRATPPHAPSPPPARPRPAVWHRAPQRPGAAPPPAAPSREPEPEPGPVPEPAPAADAFATGQEPDWLLDLMEQDAEQAAARQKAVRTRRRLAGWSSGVGVMAAVAAVVWWVAEERRVDDALVVVAENKLPAVAPAAPPVPVPPPVAASDSEDVAPPAAAPPAVSAASLASPTSAAPDAPAVEDSRPGRAATRVAAAKPAPDRRGPAERRKREETLLQCRALGYDEGQCIRRGCEMTRFGLACRGGAPLTNQ